MSVFEIIVLVLLADIALSARRLLRQALTGQVVYLRFYPLDWLHLVLSWWVRR